MVEIVAYFVPVQCCRCSILLKSEYQTLSEQAKDFCHLKDWHGTIFLLFEILVHLPACKTWIVRNTWSSEQKNNRTQPSTRLSPMIGLTNVEIFFFIFHFTWQQSFGLFRRRKKKSFLFYRIPNKCGVLDVAKLFAEHKAANTKARNTHKKKMYKL